MKFLLPVACCLSACEAAHPKCPKAWWRWTDLSSNTLVFLLTQISHCLDGVLLLISLASSSLNYNTVYCHHVHRGVGWLHKWLSCFKRLLGLLKVQCIGNEGGAELLCLQLQPWMFWNGQRFCAGPWFHGSDDLQYIVRISLCVSPVWQQHHLSLDRGHGRI